MCPKVIIEEIVLKNDEDEFTYEKICRTILGHLNHETQYCVNLAGGTRYMALAVQQVFEKFTTTFYYVQVEENMIVQSIFDDSIYDNDDIFYPIRHRMTIAEYLRAHEIENDLKHYPHKPIRSKGETSKFMDLWINQKLTRQDHDTIDILRNHYRNRKKISISGVETSKDKNNPAISYLSQFLRHIGFIPKQEGILTRKELEYLTGGWFEEYVYYLIEKHIKPQDIAIGVTISRKGVQHNNELDVVFTKGNKLFVIECKTGVQTDRLFNEIVYKLCAIREALLGVSCYSYLFSPKRDDSNELKRIADNMDICFIDYSMFTSMRSLQFALARIVFQAQDKQTATSIS